jgi:hypothetical protein
MLNGNRLDWTNCVKHLGNYLRFDLSEYEEIRHKRADFIWRVNGLCMRYQDAVPQVKMFLLNSYCCHFYGSQARSYSDKNVDSLVTAWNRAVRKIWNLPYDSHRILLCALNNGSNALDYIYRRFCKMYTCMAQSQNTKLSFLIRMCESDKRSILSKNVGNVCKIWDVSEKELWRKWKYERLSVCCVQEMLECEWVTEMIKELANGVTGFSENEINDILAYISTM